MVNGMAQSVPTSRHRLDRRRPLRYQELKARKKRDRRGEVAIDLSGGSPEMDYAAHGRMYGQFLLFTKIAIVCLVLLLAGMGYFLT
jgi:aa3 type cytochrome c oxidase subunit IV